MLTLPDPVRRSLLRSFPIALSAVTAVIVAGVALIAGASPPIVLMAVVVIVSIGAVGALFPKLAAAAYLAWNRLAVSFGRLARAWLSVMSFLIVVAAGRAGSKMVESQPAKSASGWVPRGTLRPEAYPSQSFTPVGKPERGWIRSLLVWGWRSRQVWTWSLLPFLLLLNAMGVRQRGSLGGNTYTLY